MTPSPVATGTILTIPCPCAPDGLHQLKRRVIGVDFFNELREAAWAVAENPSEDDDWEAVRASDLTKLRKLLARALPGDPR